MPQYRRAVIKGLMREMRAADINIDDATTLHDVTVFHRGLLYHLHFRSLDNLAWLRAKEPPVYVCEHVFVFAFSLDDRSEGITAVSLRSLDRTLSTLQRVTARYEIPLLLVGFKPTSFLEEREREGVGDAWHLEERGQVPLPPRSHFVYEEKEDLPFFKSQGAEACNQQKGGEEGKKDTLSTKKRKEGTEEAEEVVSLLSSESEEDIEMGRVEEKEKEKEEIEQGEEEGTEEEEKKGEEVSDKIRREALQFLQYRMPRCDGYMEIGWSPKKMEVDEPLSLLSSLLETQRRVKERAFSPEAYSISRERLEKRQHGGPRYRLLHLLEGLLCVLLLPLPCILTTAFTFSLGLYYIIWMLVLIMFPSLLTTHHNNIPFMLRPLVFLVALPPVLVWNFMVLVFLLLGCIFAPLVLWLLAFRYHTYP